MELQCWQTSSLTKTMMDSNERPAVLKKLSCLKGEEVSYQLVCKMTGTGSDARACRPYTYKIDSELADCITIREVVNIPSEVPAHIGVFWGHDEDFITTKPGLFPDLLRAPYDDELEMPFNYFRSFWVSVKVKPNAKAGIYPIRIRIANEELNLRAERVMTLEVIDAVLPEQTLIHSEWFHSDCLMSYYKVSALSEEHWQICADWIKTAVDNGVNMILTPIVSLTMDRKEGVDRPVLQLVKISKEGSVYSFDFADLKRWIRMCLDLGVEYIEISHLFTQWGAKYAPTVMVWEDGQLIKKFGWHTPGMCEEYKDFIRQFLPQLVAFLKAEGVADRAIFHVSDEPYAQDVPAYSEAIELVKPYLEGFRIIDAVFDLDVYSSGIIKDPVVVTSRYRDCAQTGKKPDFVYYLFGQSYHYSNRLFAMHSRRNRVLALQLYANDIIGFLHWGFNFYYNYDSRYLINPFLNTAGRNVYASGCPFIVYPGEDGIPMESIRLKVLKEAMQDLRALQLLESYTSKEEVQKLIEEAAGEPVEFDWRPPDDAFILNFREKINRLIQQAIEKQ